MSGIAIVGMACRDADTHTPDEMWETVLACRRAFRRMPPERLRIEDYLSANRRTPDTTYASQAAVIEDHEFDRARFRIGGESYRSTDYAHWLALEVAAASLDDAQA